MNWQVAKIINYPKHIRWGDGYAHLGFHDKSGRKYTVEYDQNWVGRYEGNTLLWSIGQKPAHESGFGFTTSESAMTAISTFSTAKTTLSG